MRAERVVCRISRARAERLSHALSSFMNDVRRRDSISPSIRDMNTNSWAPSGLWRGGGALVIPGAANIIAADMSLAVWGRPKGRGLAGGPTPPGALGASRSISILSESPDMKDMNSGIETWPSPLRSKRDMRAANTCDGSSMPAPLRTALNSSAVSELLRSLSSIWNCRLRSSELFASVAFRFLSTTSVVARSFELSFIAASYRPLRALGDEGERCCWSR